LNCRIEKEKVNKIMFKNKGFSRSKTLGELKQAFEAIKMRTEN